MRDAPLKVLKRGYIVFECYRGVGDIGLSLIHISLDYAKEIGYPVIVRPAFTLGGTGGGIANDEAELDEIATGGLRLSPITQVLIEKCIAGWKRCV